MYNNVVSYLAYVYLQPKYEKLVAAHNVILKSTKISYNLASQSTVRQLEQVLEVEEKFSESIASALKDAEILHDFVLSWLE